MAFQVQDAGTLRTITGMIVRQGGVNRQILTVRVMHDGVLRTVAQFSDPLSASASPVAVSGNIASEFADPVITNSATASPAGGRSPFTYQWVRISGNTALATNSTSATTAFSATVPPGEFRSAVFQVTITDAAGQSDTAQVTATFINDGEPSGGIDP